MRRVLTLTLAPLFAFTGLIVGADEARAETYDFRWTDTTLSVYDGTAVGSTVDVLGILADWNKAKAVTLYATTDRASAQIVVETVDNHPYPGQAFIANSGGVITSCRVAINTQRADDAYSHHIGLHEVGHCLGLAHTDRKGSIMREAVSALNYMTAPSKWDLRELRNHYR